MEYYTLKEFVAKYRPDGKGHISIESEGEVLDDIAFEEVVCDFCNELITEDLADREKKVVAVDEEIDYALCLKCASECDAFGMVPEDECAENGEE